MFLIVLLNDQYCIFNPILELLFELGGVIILLLIMAGLTYALYTIEPQNILASNAIWLSLVVLIGIIIIPTILFGKLTGVVGLAGILTVVIVIATGLLGYYMGDKIITFDWDRYLTYALIGLIIVLVIGQIFITDYETMLTFIYITSIMGLIIFVLLLLSNHKKLKENADKCVDGKVIPNYPQESWGLVIKIVNVFTDLIRILGIRKLRK
jgi:hypothetical protein